MTMNGNFSVFDISGRAMSAQLVRMNTTASNLANAGTVSGSEAGAFRSMKPVFRTVMDGQGRATVQVDQVTTSKMAPSKRHDPTNPLADAEGNVDVRIAVLADWLGGALQRREMDRATELAGQIAPYVEHDYRAALVAADYYRAIGDGHLHAAAQARVIALAGGRTPPAPATGN